MTDKTLEKWLKQITPNGFREFIGQPLSRYTVLRTAQTREMGFYIFQLRNGPTRNTEIWHCTRLSIQIVCFNTLVGYGYPLIGGVAKADKVKKLIERVEAHMTMEALSKTEVLDDQE